MLHVGLTGNVASGKSTVARHFRDWGATLIDADAIVRELQAPGTPLVAAIAREFGEGLLNAAGVLDRARLRQLVMADPARREALNRLVHPAVEARRLALLSDAAGRGDRIVVSDIPLLFEVMDPLRFDAVVLVDAPEAVRQERLQRHRGLAEAEARALIAAQLPAEVKRPHSDFIIENDADLATLETRARAVWHALATRA